MKYLNPNTGIMYRVYYWGSDFDEGHGIGMFLGNEWQFATYGEAFGWFHRQVSDYEHSIQVIPMIDPLTLSYYEGHRNQFVVMTYTMPESHVTIREVYQIYVEEVQ